MRFSLILPPINILDTRFVDVWRAAEGETPVFASCPLPEKCEVTILLKRISAMAFSSRQGVGLNLIFFRLPFWTLDCA